MKKQEKWIQYAYQIQSKIQELIDEKELQIKGNDDLKAFIYAIGVAVPANVYQKLTGDKSVDNLKFNHIANHLILEKALDAVKNEADNDRD